MCKILRWQWICWCGGRWRTSVISGRASDLLYEATTQLSTSARPEHKGAHSPRCLGKYRRHSDAHARTARRHIHVNTQLLSATDGHVVLSRCDEFDPNLIVWTTGNSANPAPACGVRQRRRTRYPTLRFSLTLLLVSLPWIVATPPRSFAPPSQSPACDRSALIQQSAPVNRTL